MSTDRESLFPCPACGGNRDGERLSKERPCRWCKNSGLVDRTGIRKFFRWRSILKRNAPRCFR